MADEPKPNGAPAGGQGGAPKPAGPSTPSAGDPFVEIISMFGGAFIVLYIVSQLFMTIGASALFSHGLKGLTPQGIILNHTRPIASLDNPLGAGVVALHDLSVYNDPGMHVIGAQAFNARGKILQGPVLVDGVNYYYVDFVTGADGWVSENDIGYVMSEPTAVERAVIWVFSFLTVLRVMSFILSLLLVFLIVYIIRQLTLLNVNERKLLYPEQTNASVTPVNPKWERVLAHIESVNENDWRLAIIEADIVLSDLLDALSLQGDTMGDKLKAVEKSDFTTIDNAWEAHKIRNQIAHEGSDFQLSQREARRVVEMYRLVFEEFGVI